MNSYNGVVKSIAFRGLPSAVVITADDEMYVLRPGNLLNATFAELCVGDEIQFHVKSHDESVVEIKDARLVKPANASYTLYSRFVVTENASYKGATVLRKIHVRLSRKSSRAAALEAIESVARKNGFNAVLSFVSQRSAIDNSYSCSGYLAFIARRLPRGASSACALSQEDIDELLDDCATQLKTSPVRPEPVAV